MKYLTWNKVHRIEDLSSFVYGPSFSMLIDENNVICSRGHLERFEILKGKHPQDFMVLFIKDEKRDIIEIHDLRLESLLVNIVIEGGIVYETIMKISEDTIYFLGKNEKLYSIDSNKLNIGELTQEETSISILKEKMIQIKGKIPCKTRVYYGKHISIENQTIKVTDLADLAKKNTFFKRNAIHKKITKGVITDFTCGGGYLFCSCTGDKNKFPDKDSCLMALNLETLDIVAIYNTELSYHATISCTSDGSRIACHNKDWSFRILMFDHEKMNFSNALIIREGGHPSFLKFSVDDNWLFYGNSDGISSFVSKCDDAYTELSGTN